MVLWTGGQQSWHSSIFQYLHFMLCKHSYSCSYQIQISYHYGVWNEFVHEYVQTAWACLHFSHAPQCGLGMLQDGASCSTGCVIQSESGRLSQFVVFIYNLFQESSVVSSYCTHWAVITIIITMNLNFEAKPFWFSQFKLIKLFSVKCTVNWCWNLQGLPTEIKFCHSFHILSCFGRLCRCLFYILDLNTYAFSLTFLFLGLFFCWITML